MVQERLDSYVEVMVEVTVVVRVAFTVVVRATVVVVVEVAEVEIRNTDTVVVIVVLSVEDELAVELDKTAVVETGTLMIEDELNGIVTGTTDEEDESIVAEDVHVVELAAGFGTARAIPARAARRRDFTKDRSMTETEVLCLDSL